MSKKKINKNMEEKIEGILIDIKKAMFPLDYIEKIALPKIMEAIHQTYQRGIEDNESDLVERFKKVDDEAYQRGLEDERERIAKKITGIMEFWRHDKSLIDWEGVAYDMEDLVEDLKSQKQKLLCDNCNSTKDVRTVGKYGLTTDVCKKCLSKMKKQKLLK